MRINKAAVIAPLFALMPLTMANKPAPQINNNNKYHYLEKVPNKGILANNAKKIKTQKASLGETLMALWFLALYVFAAYKFDKMEREDRENFMKP